jgi:hypothetical protein
MPPFNSATKRRNYLWLTRLRREDTRAKARPAANRLFCLIIYCDDN